jgi:signal transduction histidine kinase
MIKARWFYAPTLFVMGLLSKLDPLGKNFFPVPTMLFLFFSFILLNIVFYKLVHYIEGHNKRQYLNILATSQICVELVFFVIILHLSGGAGSVAPIFFFIPIVSSIILFDVIGSLIIAFISGVFVNSIVILEYKGILENVPGYPGTGVMSYDQFLVLLTSTITITAVYFIVGALTGYLSSVIKNRESQLSESKRRAQLQAERLRLLNEAYNSYARQLVRKDLDLTKQNERFSQLDKEKSEFVSTVSHQLRTPLSAIKWTLDALLKNEESGNLTVEQRALLMKAFESNERIINLIRDMLGIDKIESGALGFSFIEINLVDLINNIIDEVSTQANRRNIKISLGTSQDLPKVSVDPQKMRAVFQNLIENSLKYTRPGGEVKIAFDTSTPDFLKISVSDNGIGIPKAQQTNIFNRFFRAENAKSLDPEGSGLGLFIVKTIIKRHGGDMSFESEEGKGTTFHITLPLHH